MTTSYRSANTTFAIFVAIFALLTMLNIHDSRQTNQRKYDILDNELEMSVQRHATFDGRMYHCYETDSEAVKAFYSVRNVPLTPFAKMLLSEIYECQHETITPPATN
jgi:hypothetical protein